MLWRRSLLALLLIGCAHARVTRGTPIQADLALVGAKIYPSPMDPPINDGAILIRDGHIVAVEEKSALDIGPDVPMLDCGGKVVVDGFWNSHVHVLTPGLLRADTLSSGQITAALQEMLTRWGFTTVFDIASTLPNTTLIRQRIAAGEVMGPRILTVGEPFWVKGGTPVYVKGFLDAHHIAVPEIESIAQARRRVRQQLDAGADGIKIFANSIQSNGILTMPLDVASAIVTEAHARGRPVFAHVSNNEGIEVALASGVDVLAHTTPVDEPWSPSFAERLVAAHMALTPTLTLWDVESKKFNSPRSEVEKGMQKAADQLSAFLQAGGQVLFGTDVGYIDQFNPSEEFAWMSRAGMSFRQILASLTTNPAHRFGRATHSGRIARGMDADLVVLDADPALDPTGFARVRYTIKGGRIIYSAR